MPRRKPKLNLNAPVVAQDGPVAFRVEFGERIRSVLDEFASRAEAAEVAGVTAEHLASYIAGRAKPPFELVARIAAARSVSLEWLATGDGPRASGDSAQDGFVAVPPQPEPDARYGGEEAIVPLLFLRSWLRANVKGPDDALRIVIHRGTSNEPAIRDGDAMLVDTTVRRIAEDGLYVFPRDGKYQAKFVETFLDGRVALTSRRPEYGVQTLPADEAAKLLPLGRVCWRGGML